MCNPLSQEGLRMVTTATAPGERFSIKVTRNYGNVGPQILSITHDNRSLLFDGLAFHVSTLESRRYHSMLMV